MFSPSAILDVSSWTNISKNKINLLTTISRSIIGSRYWFDKYYILCSNIISFECTIHFGIFYFLLTNRLFRLLSSSVKDTQHTHCICKQTCYCQLGMYPPGAISRNSRFRGICNSKSDIWAHVPTRDNLPDHSIFQMWQNHFRSTCYCEFKINTTATIKSESLWQRILVWL